jgi:hypothetical protein
LLAGTGRNENAKRNPVTDKRLHLQSDFMRMLLQRLPFSRRWLTAVKFSTWIHNIKSLLTIDEIALKYRFYEAYTISGGLPGARGLGNGRVLRAIAIRESSFQGISFSK